MNQEEQPSPDQTGTWGPDFDALTREAWHVGNRKPNTSATRRVIAAYRRQQAERGVVEVRRELVERIKDRWPWYDVDREFDDLNDAIVDLIDATLSPLAAAQEQGS